MITTQPGDCIIQIDEFENKDDYFRIFYTEKSEILIEYYNADNFNLFFQARIPQKMQEKFFETTIILDIYDNIKSSFANNEYTLKDDDNGKKLNIIYHGANKSLGLKKIIQENYYFSTIFKKILNEKERQINELKSKIQSLEKELKKINKNISNIKEFNSKYHTSIDINGASLYMDFQNNGDDFLMNLSGLKFNCLKELDLKRSNITNINPFKTMNLDKLQTLNLYKNQVQDLSPLKNANLQVLKKINLQKNNISDINPLIDLNCINLEILLLDNNQIEDISPLAKVKFNHLQKLTLDHNRIKDISQLEYIPFKKLKILSLHHNKIIDIRVFNKILSNNLMSLESLWIYNNNFNNENNDKILNILNKEIKDFL